jgi:hypothetical protein
MHGSTGNTTPRIDIAQHQLRGLITAEGFTKLGPDSRARFLRELSLVLQGPVRSYQPLIPSHALNLDTYVTAIVRRTPEWRPGTDHASGRYVQELYEDLQIELEGQAAIRMTTFNSGFFYKRRAIGLVHPCNQGQSTNYQLTAIVRQ